MIYITVRQPPRYRQMSLEEFLFAENIAPVVLNDNETNTRTYTVDKLSEKRVKKTDIPMLTASLRNYNSRFKILSDEPRENLYKTFYTPKKNKGIKKVIKDIYAAQSRYIGDESGAVSKVSCKLRDVQREHRTREDKSLMSETMKYCTNVLNEAGFEMTEDKLGAIFKSSFRRIDAPCEELKNALRELKSVFENIFGALYHTSAFAYVKHRSTIDAVKRHQSNESKWFCKLDLSNFFGSTTVDFIMRMFSMIYPFSEVVKTEQGRGELEKALSLCTLGGVLPQGTPISPTITNIMMIPIDYKLSNALRDFKKQRFVFTRYADDFLISSKYDFKYREVEKLVTDTLAEFDAPFRLNTEKTRYGSSNGANWNLGVMLNKDNEITVGYRDKRRFQAMLSSYIMDRQHGARWDKLDVQTLEGYRNYYRMVEGETIDRIIEHLSGKFGVDIVQAIKEDLRA